MKTIKKSYLFKILTSLVLLLLVLSACSTEDPTPTPVPPEPTEATEPEPTEAPVEEVEAVEIPEISQPIYLWGEVAERMWVLVGYGDAANPTVVEEGTKVTATFSSAEPTVSGSGGCNNYFADYASTDDGSLTINGPIGSTRMACDTMEAEAAYFAALEAVTNWNLTEEGRLELTYTTDQPYEEKLVYTLGQVPLTGTTWRLVSMGDPESPTAVEEGTSVTAVFSPENETAGSINGNATCNDYTTSYTLDGDNISFGAIAGTMMMCPVGADQEAAYLAALGTAQTYVIAGANMQITYDGGVLNYSSQNLPLTHVLWQAVMVADQPVPEGMEITTLFEPGDMDNAGTVGGSTGCNNYNSSYQTSQDPNTMPSPNYLTINSPMAMTMAFCPDETQAAVEQSTMAILESAETYEIFGDQLVISSPNGDIQFAANRQPLVGTQWQLVSMGDKENPQAPLEDANFTAQFNRLPTLPSGTVTGETGCNQYNSTFTANLNEIKVNLPATTRMACDDGLAEQEQQFFLGLNAATEYRILGNNLQIPYSEGMVLNFVATLPDVGEGIDLTPLADTFWYLLAIGDNPIIPYTEITAGFDVAEDGVTGAVSGDGGCNAYNADISTADGSFAVGPIATTGKACASEVLDQEGGYLDWLSKAYAYDRVGDQLLISTENGVLTYNSTPVQDQSQELQNKTWYLVSVGNLTAVPFSNATTFFSPDGTAVSGNTGCNDFNGSYNAEPGNALTISGFSSTQAACTTEDLSKQEEALLIFLPSATSYVVVGNQMQIQTVDGSVINYTAVPPESPVPPTAVITGPDVGDVGQQLTFDSAQSIPGSLPIVSQLWDMGDGSSISVPVVVYSYNTPGTYNITLTVTDSAGQTNTATKSIQIAPVVDVTPPNAAIEGPAMAFVGEPVTFSAANSQQGTAAISSYQWESGDGNNSAPGSDNSFTTIYSQAGTYYASVTVADAGGLSDTASMQIVINAQLEGTNWSLSNTIPGTSINLNFANGNISGFASCNSYNGGYTTTLAAGNSNDINIGPLTSTGSICSEEIMSQEQGYLATLQTASSYTINGTTLTLTTPTGPLTFAAAVPTPFVSP